MNRSGRYFPQPTCYKAFIPTILSPNPALVIDIALQKKLEQANQLIISYQSASNLVVIFQKIGILKEITGKKRDQRFMYADYVAILSEGTKPL